MYKRIDLAQAQEGMILAQDITAQDGRVLIACGMRLEEKQIQYLKIHFPETTLAIADLERVESEPLKKNQQDQIRNIHSLSLEDVQSIIQDVFYHKKDFETTKKILETLKQDIKEAFEFLALNHEINDKKFVEIANNLIESIIIQKELANPGYLYLIEMEKWHPDTFNHSIDVAFFTLYLASQFTHDMGELNSLFLGGLLHDIGKYVYFKDNNNLFYSIITKTGPLSEDEFQLLKKHVDVEDFFNEKFVFLNKKERENIIYGALDHHEKLDGTGYIKAKKGSAISLSGRIVAVSDIYDAMVRKREYKSMVRPNMAMRYVLELGTQGKLDKRYVHYFKDLLGLYPTGSVIPTSKGDAIVVGQSPDANKPVIMLIENFDRGELDLRMHSEIDIYEEVT
jgi:HD-GYP domain-containing protein (c-di-GMP phosphodiesterase class II)